MFNRKPTLPASIQNLAAFAWPVTLLICCIVAPWTIGKIIEELRNNK